MTGFKYLSNMEALMKLKRKRPKEPRGDGAPDTPTSASGVLEDSGVLRGSGVPSPKSLVQTAKISDGGQPTKTNQLLTSIANQEVEDSATSTLTSGMRRVISLPQLTMPSAQQPIARLGSLRRTCETRPPVHTPNRLSAIMDIEIPKSTERNVTMALSEIPSKLLNPAAQLLAGETPERLVNFRVSLHPLVGTMGMSVAQAVREGFAMLVDKSITPSRIAESDQTRLQSIAENPTNSLHLSANSATPGEESTTDMSGRSYQRKTCQSSKAVRFSDEDDIFHLSPARSQGSLGDKKCSISSSGGHPEGDGLASQETNDLCALKRMQNANKPESRIEADPDIPVLPELNFGRASGDFGSLFANFQGELQLVVPRNPDLPGLAQETDRSNKGACSDAHDASDTNDADDELDVEDVLGYFLDDSAQSDGIRDRTCREHSMLRCDSPTVGNGQTDLVMQADSSIIGSGIFRKFPLLPGPPPSLPLPHLPPVRTITASRGSAFTVVTPHRPQQQRRQGSREFTPAGPAVPVSSKQPGLEIPSAYSQPTSSQQATSSYSKTFQSSSKVHTHQLIKEPQTSSALSRIEIPKSDTIFIHSSLLQLSGPSLEPSAFLHLPDPHESSSSFPTPLLSSDGPVNPFPDYSSSESSYRPEDKVIKFPIYQQSLEDLRTQRLRREAEDADSRQRSQRLVTRPNFPFISGTESLLPAPLKLTRSLQGPLTPGSPKSTEHTDSYETPSEDYKDEELARITGYLTDRGDHNLVQEINKVYSQLPPEKRKKRPDSPIPRFGDVRRYPVLCEAPNDLLQPQSARIETVIPEVDEDSTAFPPAQPGPVIPVLSSSILPCGHTYNQHKILYQQGKMTFSDMTCGMCKGICKDKHPQVAVRVGSGQAGNNMGPRPYHGTMPSQTSSTDTEPFPRYQEPPQTQPIDIPAGNPAIQSRTHYTGDAFDITSVDARQYLNPSRQQLGSTSYSSNDLSGSATVTGTTYAGSSQAGPIANVTAAPTLPRSRRTESSATSNQADKGKNVAAARVPAQGTNTNARNSLYEMLARYPMKDLRAVFPGRSDSFIREKLGLAPGTPTDPYYGREYAEHAKAGTASTSDDREFVRGNYDQEEDPFTGVPDRSNLLFSASGHFLPGVVAASTPPRMPQPPPSRPPPLPPQPAPAAASAATRASEIIEELDRLAVADPTVVSLLRASGYRGGGAPSSGSSAAATAAAAAPFLTSSLSAGGPLVQGELLHQRDERARAERLERRQARLVKKASKATLKSQNSVGGGGGAGLFGRFRRANEGGGGPSAPSA